MAEDASFRVNRMEGMNKFQSMRMRVFWKEMINHFRGKPVELLSFEDIRERLRLREESYKGSHEVPLKQIGGSVGRYRDFTRDFLPKSNTMQERWSRVYAVANSMSGFPPIELYKVGDVYFVRDGNHRVSVARQLGAKTIEAHVTELPTTVNITPDMSNDDLDNATAYAAFLEESGIETTRLHHQPLQLSERWRYTELIGHIYLQKYVLEKMTGKTVNMPEAAANWYDNVYRPALTLIRKYDVLDRVGARTETDLYLWLVDHLRGIREQYGDNAPSRKISHALIDFLSDRKIPVPEDLHQEKDDSMILSKTQVMRVLENVPDHDVDDENEAYHQIQEALQDDAEDENIRL